MNTNHISYIRVKYITKYNLCTPFKHDIRCASLCGVVTKERREKRAQRESCLKGVQSLKSSLKVTFNTSGCFQNTYTYAHQIVFTADNAFQLSRLAPFNANIEQVGYAKNKIRHKL